MLLSNPSPREHAGFIEQYGIAPNQPFEQELREHMWHLCCPQLLLHVLMFHKAALGGCEAKEVQLVLDIMPISRNQCPVALGETD